MFSWMMRKLEEILDEVDEVNESNQPYKQDEDEGNEDER